MDERTLGGWLVGPRTSRNPALSSHTRVGPDRWLSTAADLPTAIHRDGRRTLCLVGHASDPNRPDLGEADLLAEVAAASHGPAPGDTSHLGGRWVLLDGTERQVMVTDTAGLRQLFHHRDRGGRTWAASSDTLLADELSLEEDARAVAWQRRHQEAHPRAGSWLPGTRARHAEVRRLLPNHLLDLETGRAGRWWPDADLERCPDGRGMRLLVDSLGGQLAATGRRTTPITILLTSGRDSRLLLAAAEAAGTDADTATLALPGDLTTEVEIPRRLAKQFGRAHHVLEPPAAPSPSFGTAYRHRTPAAQNHYAAKAEVMYGHLRRRRMAITGHVSGVAKRHYRGVRSLATPTPERVARALGLDEDPFVVEALDEWVASLGDLRGFDVEDLVYWEQRAGTWLSSWMAETDLAWRDVVAPFNVRDLLVGLLGVAPAQRSAPDYPLWHRTAESLASGAMDLPIGSNVSARRRARVRKLMRRLARRRRGI